MQIKAVFFDLDGVLAISENFHYYAWEKVLDNLQVSHKKLNLQNVLGFSDSQVAQYLIKTYSLSNSEEELAQEKRKQFATYVHKGFASPLGRDQFLQFLKGKFILAVVSSCLKEEIKAILNTEKISSYFNFLVGAEDTSESKPSPDPYLLALKKAQVLPNEVLAIEDSPIGITAALKANLTVWGMATTFHSLPNHPEVPFFKDFKAMQTRFSALLNLP